MIVGIDIGSSYTKTVWIGRINEKIEYQINKTSVLPENLINELVQKKPVKNIVVTGYGRHLLKKSEKISIITEIKAHAIAAYNEFNKISFVIDIGGQDSKVIQIDIDNTFSDFLMNDKCAAGTGKFLEIAASRMDLSLDKMDELAFKAKNPCQISSMCAVFAESEIISLITKGEKIENISAGIFDSIASRVSSMAKKLGAKKNIMFTGGGAKSHYLKYCLEKKLSTKIITPKFPQYMGALGAALSVKNKTS